MRPMTDKYAHIFEKHRNVALQVSGGKDSIATLFLFAPWWDRLTVYWLNPGNPLPETVSYMAALRDLVPNFVEVKGRQQEVVAADGWPSDVVPQAHTTDGIAVFGPKSFKVQSRISCCYRSLMLPMHEEMIARGVTCIIRGKREDEMDKSATRSGDVVDGIELVYPIWDWSSDDVFAYLDGIGVPVPGYYEHAKHSLDCIDCTAWWGEGLPLFLRAKHPDAYREYTRRMVLIKEAIASQMDELERV